MLMEVASSMFVTMFDHERVVLSSIRYVRPKRYRVIAIVPKIRVIKVVFVQKVIIIVHVFALANTYVFGIYVDCARE